MADGTNDGGISGAGGGEAGACADAANGIRAEAAASAAHAMRLRNALLRIGLLPSLERGQYEPALECGTGLRLSHKAAADKSISYSVALVAQEEPLNER